MPKARPMHPDWARSVRDQCVSAGVPFFFKQWGEYVSAANSPKPVYPNGFRWLYADGRSFPGHLVDHGCSREAVPIYHMGKKPAGRLLDGRTWDERPEVASLAEARR